MQFHSQGDGRSAFLWLQAALQLDARAILSEPGFEELTDAYFEVQSKRQRIETLLIQAGFPLDQDPRDPANMLAANGFLAEASKLAAELGEATRLPGIERRKNTLQQRHREALIEELNGLLQELEDARSGQGPTSQQTLATLSVLKGLTHVLAKIEQAQFTVEDVKPHLQRAFEYYARLQSDAEFEADLNSAEGYSLSYMLLSKVNTWQTG
jgi:hypothetical protein